MKPQLSGWSLLEGPNGWEFAEEPFRSGEEGVFQSLVEEHPEAVPLREINPIASAVVPIGREVPTDVGPVDLLFLDDTGRLLLVECKLIQNPEARREVVAQLVEYASRISHGWDAKHVISVADEYSRKFGKPEVTARLNEALASLGVERRLTRKALERLISDGLKSTTRGPVLVVASNLLEQRALVLADYLRRQKIPIVCVEFRRLRVGQSRVLVGYVRAASLLVTISAAQREALNEEQWLGLVEEEPVAAIRRGLLLWAKDLHAKDVCVYRIGSKELMVQVKESGRLKTALSVSEGRFYIHFTDFRSLGWQDQDVENLRSSLEAIIGSGKLSAREQFPSFPLDALSGEDRLTRVTELLGSALLQSARR